MPSKPLETHDDTIAVGDKISAFGNVIGIVTEITEREGASPLFTYEAVYDAPSIKVKAGQTVHCDSKYCRKIV